MDGALHVDESVLLRLAGAGPRYTSYPTAPEWTDDFGPDDATDAAVRASATPDQPLSLYVHLPFCSRLCLYCGCTVEISGKPSRADAYLDAVEREIELVSATLGERRDLVQMHWGGGTPTFLSVEQLQRMHGLVAERFRFLPGAEISLEVDPHVTTHAQIDALMDLGFNRVSMGVQDLDPHVQHVVRREQTAEETDALVARCRERSVEGLNMDLMYGLPDQTEEGFGRTLDEIVRLAPDRLAVFGYAHVPWMKPAQKALEARGTMPGPTERARLFGLAIEKLGAAGYEVIGLDHFAKADDPMAKALHEGTLHRNFMGYALAPSEDMVAFGMSAIGELAGTYVQNARTTAEYEAALSDGRLATIRGLRRSPEDELRRAVILSLMCRMRIDLDELEAQTGREGLAEHFAAEWTRLRPFADEGFCRMGERRLEVTPTGRLFLRHMAMVFDEHLHRRRAEAAAREAAGEDGPRFSQTI